MGTFRGARRSRGAAAVEFAVMVPLVLMLLFEIMSWAYMFSFRQALSQAVAEGARAGVGAPLTGCPATGAWPTPACLAATAAQNAVEADLTSFKYNGTALTCGAGLTCSITGVAAGANCGGTQCVKVTVTYPYRSQPLLGGLPTNVGPFNLVLPPDLSFTSIVQVS